MNNKKLGTAFEREVCELLSASGWWAHFITPNESGAQPFDIIAAKDGETLVADCKTCAQKIFNISRLEDNQIFAFDKWLACGNSMPYVIVKYKEQILFIRYDDLKVTGKINLEMAQSFCKNI